MQSRLKLSPDFAVSFAVRPPRHLHCRKTRPDLQIADDNPGGI